MGLFVIPSGRRSFSVILSGARQGAVEGSLTSHPHRPHKLGKSGSSRRKLGRSCSLRAQIGLQITRSAQFTQIESQSAQFAPSAGASAGPNWADHARGADARCAMAKDPSTSRSGVRLRRTVTALGRLDRNCGRPAVAAPFAHCRSPSPANAAGVRFTARPAYGQPSGLSASRLSAQDDNGGFPPPGNRSTGARRLITLSLGTNARRR